MVVIERKWESEWAEHVLLNERESFVNLGLYYLELGKD